VAGLFVNLEPNIRREFLLGFNVAGFATVVDIQLALARASSSAGHFV
jgi:hypothetical protein